MMKASLVAFSSKLVYPCKKAALLLVFKCKLLKRRRRRTSRLLAVTAPSLRACRAGSRRIASALLSAFQGLKKKKNGRSERDDDQLQTMTPSASDAGRDRLLQLFPTPLLTPPSSRRSRAIGKASLMAGCQDDLQIRLFMEDACRSFENYLVEMMVDEGRVRDLMDVEELLFCWKNLKCPVFVDVVSRFYRELCKDLFAATASEHGDTATP